MMARLTQTASRRVTLRVGRGVDIAPIAISVAIFATIALRNWGYVVYATQLAAVLAILLHLAAKRLQFQAGLYLGFGAAFSAWCMLSAFWAADPNRVFAGTLGIVQYILFGSAIAAYVIAERRPDFLLKSIAWSIAGLVVVLLLVTPLDVWQQAMAESANVASDEDRIGYTVRYHPNALGRILAIGAVLWLYLLRTSTSHRFPKLVMIAAIVAVLVLTKSRTSLSLLVIGVFLLLVLLARHVGRMIFSFLLASGIIAGGIWAIFNVQFLYQTIGFRFDSLINPDTRVDASANTRSEMLSIALEIWRGSPFNGVGLNNFSYYYFYDYSGWSQTYAHNTYAEILADLGVIGLILFYAVTAWVLVKAIGLLRRTTNDSYRRALALVIALTVSSLVADTASISFTNEPVQLVAVLCYTWVAVMVRGENSVEVDASVEASDHAGQGPGHAHTSSRRPPASNHGAQTRMRAQRAPALRSSHRR